MKKIMSTLGLVIAILVTTNSFSQQLGDEQNVTAISNLRAQASWDGCSAGSDQNTATYNPPPGWVIVEYKTITHSQSNGSSSVSVIEQDLNFVTKTKWSTSYDELIDMAASRNNDELKAKLQQKKSEYENFYHSVQSNKNTIYAKVKAKAHGSCLDRKRGWSEISVTTKLRYVGTSQDLNQIIEQLKEQYNLTD